MGLFDNKQKKLVNEFANAMVNSRKTGTFKCGYCGRPQKITYYGSNDTWTCSRCGVKNRCN